MTVVWTPNAVFRKTDYSSEADLETAIVQVQTELFGLNRIYLDVKRKIGSNIPDAYLIDLSSSRPRLYVVENELAVHHPIRHIAMQLLEFSLSFAAELRTVQKILLDALQQHPSIKLRCENYAATHGFRGLDHLLDELVHGTPFAALVIIDEVPDRLRNILAKQFTFAVEVLELSKYSDSDGHHIYRFEPFLEGVEDTSDVKNLSRLPLADLTDVDTVLVPARDEGFTNTFMKENRWYSIRLNGIMRPQLKWIAAYRVAPISAITHIAPIHSIEPWEDTDKFVVNFAESAKEISAIGKGSQLTHLQNIKYTTYDRLRNAKTLDDL